MVNVEKIKERLKEFQKGVTPKMREQWRKEAEEELRQEKLFWEGQDIAEEEERKMILEGKPDGVSGLIANQIVP